MVVLHVSEKANITRSAQGNSLTKVLYLLCFCLNCLAISVIHYSRLAEHRITNITVRGPEVRE